MTEEKRDELHLKYRPSTFDDFIGNEVLKESLLAVLDRTRTFIFFGPRGCGKTTLARLVAKKLGISDSNISEIDAADKTGVADARAIKEAAQYYPLDGKYKIFIIDECHRLSGNAMDSLLKTLENPPEFCYFVLCTTDLAKVSSTIKSRAKKYEVKTLSPKESKFLIRWICHSEGFSVDPSIVDEVIKCSEGIPREIIVALDTVRDVKDPEAAKSLLYSFVNKEIKELCQVLLQRLKWPRIAAVLKGLEDDPENVRRAVLGYMNAILMKEENDTAALILEVFKDPFYNGKSDLTRACYDLYKQ